MIAPVQAMDNRRLGEILKRETTILDSRLGFWRVEYADRNLMVVTDESHDRMRIMTPVIDEGELEHEDYRKLLEANFDRALDAKYAISNELLWSVFVHPFRDLTERLLLDALDQVTTLAENFGTTFSSSDLFFGGRD